MSPEQRASQFLHWLNAQRDKPDLIDSPLGAECKLADAIRAAVADERERAAAQSMRLLADVVESDFEKGNDWEDVVRWMRQHADAAGKGMWKPLTEAIRKGEGEPDGSGKE